ncbi:hypothetical protein EIP91_000913 [Steccherinum ochraceum]|uniref:A to I editase domain-containing protein n=1 Tax=Steccherinum ochraceum TaxID=92696 RepID=A0A4R0RLI1_9APHY|nr:hypothetical protein EIP91_000913 [Steccherinum ochraceum]
MSNDPLDPDNVVRVILSLYSTLAFKPPSNQFTILAAFALHEPSTNTTQIISLGTGSKCLPAIRLCKEGDALHDCHAEVIARRGAIRWFLEEVSRSDDHRGLYNVIPWLQQLADGKFALRHGVQLVLYVSTVPCGDASTRYLASFQDAEMAALKNSAAFPALPPGSASRGRDNYSLFGVLRTKPGRADSPPTLSMSCSDKIASWNVLGLQGALGTRILHPIYISSVIIGEVPEDLRDTVRTDCERALHGRLSGRLERLPEGYSLRHPVLYFTSLPFMHARSAFPSQDPVASCNDSLCWTADSSRPHEVLINGIKRGVSPKNQHNPKFRPLLSKLALFNLHHDLAQKIVVRGTATVESKADPGDEGNDQTEGLATYYDTKQAMSEYQACKIALQGAEGPFCGWVKSGAQWERFKLDGSV